MALKFAYQTALAIKYLHERKLIHRDIKPENILFDENFNIKLCDFGWSCENNDEIRQSICGTYEYMSPEIIYLGKHDQKIDIWCLGILLYEMVHGFPPFAASNLKEMKQQFQKKHILIKKGLNTDTKDLIKFILKSQYQQRPSIDQVLQHNTFQKNLKNFEKPFSQQEKELLAKNFMINSAQGRGRTLPLIIEQIKDKKKRDKKINNVINSNLQYQNNFYRFDNNNQNLNQYNLNNKISSQHNANQQIAKIINIPKLNINKDQQTKNFDTYKNYQTNCTSNKSINSLQFLDNSFSSQKYNFGNAVKNEQKKYQYISKKPTANTKNFNLNQNYYLKTEETETGLSSEKYKKFNFQKKNQAYSHLDNNKIQSTINNSKQNKPQKKTSYNIYRKKYFIKEEPQIDIGQVNIYSPKQNDDKDFNKQFRKEYQTDESFMSDQDSIIVNSFVKKDNEFVSPKYQSSHQIQSEKNILRNKISPDKNAIRYRLSDLNSVTSSIRSINSNQKLNFKPIKKIYDKKQNTHNVIQKIQSEKDLKSYRNFKHNNQYNQNKEQDQKQIYNTQYYTQKNQNNVECQNLNQSFKHNNVSIQNLSLNSYQNKRTQNISNQKNHQIIKQNINGQTQKYISNQNTNQQTQPILSYNSAYFGSMRSITSYQKNEKNGAIRKVTRIKL